MVETKTGLKRESVDQRKDLWLLSNSNVALNIKVNNKPSRHFYNLSLYPCSLPLLTSCFPPLCLSQSIIPPLADTHGTLAFRSFHYNKPHSLEHFLHSLTACGPWVPEQTPPTLLPHTLFFPHPPSSGAYPGAAVAPGADSHKQPELPIELSVLICQSVSHIWSLRPSCSVYVEK